MSKQQTPLEVLAELASILDKVDFVEGTSTVQKRIFRDAADRLHDVLKESCGEVTPPILLAFWNGAATEATMVAHNNPLNAILQQAMGNKTPQQQTTPDNNLVLFVAYLARDILVGERVE